MWKTGGATGQLTRIFRSEFVPRGRFANCEQGSSDEDDTAFLENLIGFEDNPSFDFNQLPLGSWEGEKMNIIERIKWLITPLYEETFELWGCDGVTVAGERFRYEHDKYIRVTGLNCSAPDWL